MPPPPPAEWTPEGAPYYKFPPFPMPPPGKVIVKFKDFVPRGIKRSEYEDEQEVDAHGVPTVTLPVKHDNKKTSVSKKRKKKANGTLVSSSEPQRGTWYEQWAETENQRPLYVRHGTNDADELLAASIAFMAGRTWFKTNAQLKLSDIYTHWRNFLGLNSNENRNIKGAQDAPEAADDMDFSDEEDEDDLPSNMHNPSQKEEHPDMEDDQDASDRPADDKTLAFLANPKLTVEKFFSSFYRAKGLHTPAGTLSDGPIVVEFWFKYILRSGVIPARKASPFKIALKGLETARFELPKMREISFAFPDKLSEALCTTFGTQSPQRLIDAPTMPWAADVDGEEVQPAHGGLPGDLAMADLHDAQELAASANLNGGATVLNTAHIQPPAGDLHVPPDNVNDESNGWGSAANSGGWGGGGWDDETPGFTDGPGIAGWEEAAPSTTGWNLQPLTLAEIIPAAAAESFAASYRTGIVETSVRRIKSSSPAGTADASLPAEFAQRFARVVLEPWGRYVEGTETCAPEILSTSVGPVVGQHEQPMPSSSEAEADAGSGVHDPFKDDILVLVESSVFEALKNAEGMGIGATWIQAVPVPSVQGDGAKKKKDKKGSSKREGSELKPFWYHEQLEYVIPSFHTEL